MKKIFYTLISSIVLLMSTSSLSRAMVFFTLDISKTVSYAAENVQNVAKVLQNIQHTLAIVNVIETIGNYGSQGQIDKALGQVNNLNSAMVRAQNSAYDGVDTITDMTTKAPSSDEFFVDEKTTTTTGKTASSSDGKVTITKTGSTSGQTATTTATADTKSTSDQNTTAKNVTMGGNDSSYPNRTEARDLLIKNRNKYLGEIESLYFITNTNYTANDVANVKYNRLNSYKEILATTIVLADSIIVRQQEKLAEAAKNGHGSSSNVRQQVIQASNLELQSLSDLLDEYGLGLNALLVEAYDSLTKAPITRIVKQGGSHEKTL